MMPIAAFCIGLLLPTLTGYLVVRALEQRADVLSWPERLAFALLIGPTGTLWLTALIHLGTGLAVTLWLFLGVQLVLFGASLAWARNRKVRLIAPWTARIDSAPQWLTLGLGIILTISILKILLAASVLTLQIPTFFDDARDNWNLRAKIIVETSAIPVLIPGEETAGGGVASYPATLPLFKAWLVQLHGQWHEGLVNGVHLTWLLAAVGLVGGAVGRRRGRTWGLAAATALLGLPLLAIHGLHAYADLFLAAHVAAVLIAFFEADQAESRESFLAWVGLGIAVLVLLPGLKNEGLAVFFTSGLLLLLAVLVRSVRRGDSSTRAAGGVLGALGLAALITTLPWLIFKWQQGLTFGNAHAIADSTFGWQAGMLHAVRYHLFSEGNWLLLPGLGAGLLIARFRTAFSDRYVVLTAACLWIFGAMTGLFLFNSDLGHEALRQTGYGRAMVQVALPWTLLMMLLLPDPRAEDE